MLCGLAIGATMAEDAVVAIWVGSGFDGKTLACVTSV